MRDGAFLTGSGTGVGAGGGVGCLSNMSSSSVSVYSVSSEDGGFRAFFANDFAVMNFLGG